MRKTIKIIDETAIFVMVIAGVYFSISFVIISLLTHLNKAL
jgi:hypothetical protein